MKEEVHATEAKEDPIVSAVLEHIEKWHCVVREAMDEEGFELSFCVMAQHHGESKLLVQRVFGGLAVYLLLESDQGTCDQYWSKILYQENEFPRYLWAKILEHHSYL